jgi:hypothetical protein
MRRMDPEGSPQGAVVGAPTRLSLTMLPRIDGIPAVRPVDAELRGCDHSLRIELDPAEPVAGGGHCIEPVAAVDQPLLLGFVEPSGDGVLGTIRFDVLGEGRQLGRAHHREQVGGRMNLDYRPPV